MTDPVVESAYQKGILPDAKAVEEGLRRTDGVSGLCMCLSHLLLGLLGLSNI